MQTMVSLPVVRTAFGMAAHVAIAMMGHTWGPSDVVGCVAVAGACWQMHSRSRPDDEVMNPQSGKFVLSRTKSHPDALAQSTSPDVGSTKHPCTEASVVTRPPSRLLAPPEPVGPPETRFGVPHGGVTHESLANGGCPLSLEHPVAK